MFDGAVNGTMTQALNLSSSGHLSLISRRVHISSVTLEHLKGSYKVEPGDGQSRDSYLKEHGVVTYLVINPKVRNHHSHGPIHSSTHSERAVRGIFLARERAEDFHLVAI